MSVQASHNAVVSLVALYGEMIETSTRENAQLRAMNENLQKQLASITHTSMDQAVEIARMRGLLKGATEPPAESIPDPGNIDG